MAISRLPTLLLLPGRRIPPRYHRDGGCLRRRLCPVALGTGGRFWGGGINWGGGQININRGAHVEHWRHNPQHRRGVAYNNPNVRQKFAGTNRPGNKGQMDFRGRNGQQVLKPGGDRAKVAKQQPGNRAKAGDRGRGKQVSQGEATLLACGPAVSSAFGPEALPLARRAHRQPHRAPRAARGHGRSYGFSAPRGGRIGGRSFGGRGFGAAGAAADAADAGRMLRSSTTSSFSVVSTTVSGSTGLPTTDPTRPMSAYWRRKCKKSCRRQSSAAGMAT